MSAVKIRDVAAAAGVAESSVSRILSGVPGYRYSEDTQLRVREAANRLGYQANAAARLLKQQKSKLVGLAVRLSIHPYLNRLVIAVRDELVARGYEPVLIEPSQFSPANNSAPFPSPELLAGVLSLDLSIGQPHSEPFQRAVPGLPIVALYPVDSEDVDWVYTDGALGIELAVEHLVSLGHTRIAMSDIADSPHHSDRMKRVGWKNALRRFHLEAEAIFIESGVASSTEERAEIIESSLLNFARRPTALICTGDESALCVLGKLQARGWRIPEEFSIIGYDGIIFGAYCHPGLTTIEQPVEAIAQAGVDRLLEILDQRVEESVPRHQVLPPRLLIRGSTGPASHEGEIR